ncbi:MAG TPA: hypothetical protein PLG48_02180 [Candidatus Avimonas sp.]|nr:hypothetical protein [Candidatus Avimonas sp.]
MSDFETAKAKALKRLHDKQGIGTLGERSLHLILKYYIDPDESHHEKPVGVGRIIADIFDGERITEIQTRDFNTLRPKLEKLLPEFPVTIVYPIARIKRIIWVDPITGEATKPRKSPKTGTAWGAFKELYKIKGYLSDKNLKIKLVFLDIDEYRLKDGWAKGGKKGSHRMERIPLSFIDEIELFKPEDYSSLLPPGLPGEFTSIDLAKHIKTAKPYASTICNILYTTGAIIRIGKSGNAYIYKKARGN